MRKFYLCGGWRGVWPPSWGRLARRRMEPRACHTVLAAILTKEEFGENLIWTPKKMLHSIAREEIKLGKIYFVPKENKVNFSICSSPILAVTLNSTSAHINSGSGSATLCGYNY